MDKNGKNYPSYMTPKLINLVEKYDNSKPKTAIHHHVTPMEYMLLQKYYYQRQCGEQKPYRWYDPINKDVYQ